MNHLHVRRTIAFAIATLGCAASAAAQSVRGTVVDRGGVPVPGVIVYLVDSASTVTSRTMTGERGEFLIVAKAPGSYSVRTLRIGFQPNISDPIALATGQELQQRIELSGIAVTLNNVEISGRNVCGRAANATTASTFLLWQQARAALTATEITGQTRSIVATDVVYRRRTEQDIRRVLQTLYAMNTDSGAQPWITYPIEALRRGAYVELTRDSVTYRGPGLDMLASDEFIADHCFKLARSRDTSRVGVAFEPTSERKHIADISGTIWLDRKTAELRSLEFYYQNVERDITPEGTGGHADFVRMRDGGWFISSWRLDMPLVQRRASGGGMRRGSTGASYDNVMVGWQLKGGNVAVVMRPTTRDTLWSAPPVPLTGIVTDSATGAYVQNAYVSLREVRASNITDRTGAFTLGPLIPGSYTLEVRTASLDSVNSVNVVPFDFADSSMKIRVLVPNAAQVAAQVCGPQLRALPASAQAVIVGSVTMLGDTIRARGGSVVAEWTEGQDQDYRWREAKIDAAGNYRVCGVPAGKTLVIKATSDTGSAESVVEMIPNDKRFARRDFVVDVAEPATGYFSGLVVGVANDAPIAQAEVVIPKFAKSVLTNAKGEFRLRDVPVGTHEVIVRKLGYGPMTTQLTFEANKTVNKRVVLTAVAVLNEVKVTGKYADPLMRQFEENRKLGLGHFFTRDDLAKREMQSMAAIMSDVPAVAITRQGNRAWIGVTRSCFAAQTAAFVPGLEEHSIPQRREPQSSKNLTGLPAVGSGACCYPAVYLDHQRLYDGSGNGVVPNLNRFHPEEFEGIEVYTSMATTPTEFTGLHVTCGVIVLHTRRPGD